MNKKLILNIDENVIVRAKIYARKTSISLSDLVETYLRNLVNQQQSDNLMEDKVKRLSGKIRLPIYFDEKKTLQDYLEQKHLK